MEGGETGVRSKRCLSRNKRSQLQASTQDDPCPKENDPCLKGNVYTAIRSKQVESSQATREVDLFENEIPSDVQGLGDKGIRNDEILFYDDAKAVDDGDSTCSQNCSNKRKRITSEELGVSTINNGFPRFKKQKAISNLNQPLVMLEMCAYQRKSKIQSKIPEEAAMAKKEIADFQSETKVALNHEGQIEWEMDKERGSEPSDFNNELDSETEDKKKIQSQQDLALFIDKSSNSQICPVCSMELIMTESMNAINNHINNCLDKRMNSNNCSMLENGFSKPSGESMGEDVFFCLLCQKDLSKMNSQRRGQHISRCCDQSRKVERIPPSSNSQSQRLNSLQCPICGKGFKMSKTRQSHLKKCAQEYDVNTNQLLEIMHREKQQEDVMFGTTVVTVPPIKTNPAARVKRKRVGRTKKDDLDEEIQIALALSASIAPSPLHSDSCTKKTVKVKGGKKRGDNELPPLLLRDNESAQRAVVLRAAQVLCTKDNEDDDEDEISCTPSLAPSRFAQNNLGCLPVLSVGNLENNFDSTRTSHDKEDVDNPKEAMKIDEGGNCSSETCESSFTVDPEFSKSFLNSLYNAEIEEKSDVLTKVPRPSPLWSLAGLMEPPSCTFVVPGLLPPLSPKKGKKLLEQSTGSESRGINENAAVKCRDSTTGNAKTSQDGNLEETKELGKSTVHHQTITTINDKCAEVTPSQVADMEMLLELVQEDEISNISLDSQDVIPTSGFCIDCQVKVEEADTVPSGVPKLLQDLSSMINNSFLSDVMIKLQDGQEMVAHSFILALRSEVLAQLLTEQRTVCEKTTCSGSCTGKFCLLFEDVHKDVFEPVLRHMYTGDVSMLNINELDGIAKLAERFKLPCLLKTCKATQEKLRNSCGSNQDNEMADFATTQLDKLEENLWREKNINELNDERQASANKLDDGDFLNDDDIEEIMIFQTQSLRRKGSFEWENVEQRQSCIHEKNFDNGELFASGVNRNHVLQKDPESSNLEIKNESAMKENGLVLPNLIEGVNSSRDTVLINGAKRGNLSPKFDASVNLSHVNIATVNETVDAVENVNSIYGRNERKEITGLSTVHGKEYIEEDQVIGEKKLRGEMSPRAKDICRMSDVEITEYELNGRHRMFTRDDGQLSPDISKSIIDIEALPCNNTRSNNESTSRGSRLETNAKVECFSSHEVPSLGNDKAGIDNEPENEPDVINMSIDLSSENVEGANSDRLLEADEKPEALSDFTSLANQEHSPRVWATILPEEGCADNNNNKGSPEEVTLLEDDEVGESAVDGSVTLISDNDDEEAADHSSPAKKNPTIVPETPRISKSLPQSKSSSTDTYSEENDVDDDNEVTYTSSSPSKTQKALRDEAIKFLSKLKERVGRGRGKKNRNKKSPRRESIKRVSPAKLSPRCREKNREKKSALSPRAFRSQGSSQLGQFSQMGNISPLQELPSDFGSSPIWENDSVPDFSTVDKSPSRSPVLVQPNLVLPASERERDKICTTSTPCNSTFRRNNGRYRGCVSTRLPTVDLQNCVDNEVLDVCDEKTEGNFDAAVTISTFQDVMSPPVPSPDFLCPGSPTLPISPLPPSVVLSPDLTVTNCKSRLPGGCPQPDSPMSPSVCSFNSPHIASGLQGEKGECVKKLDLKQRSNSTESVKASILETFDLNIPLMERIKAARNGEKMCLLTNVEEDSSGNSSDGDCIGDKNDSKDKKSSINLRLQDDDGNAASSDIDEMRDISTVTDFDFYDDGGYNFDIDKFNIVDNGLGNVNIEANLENKDATYLKVTKLPRGNKGEKECFGKKKISASYQSNDEIERANVPKKRGKRINSKSHQTPVPTVSQPVTPMPNYHAMDTPTLKNELHNFGVRPLPKKKMILKLKEIYDYTHQVESPPHQETKNDPRAVDSLRSKAVGSRDVDEVSDSGTASSDESVVEGDTEFGDCTVLIEDEGVTASQQVNSWNLRDRLFSYVQSNPEMYKKILMFEPLELVSLHQNLKLDGINCGLGKLVDFLDEQCITFTTAGSRPRTTRRRGRKKKHEN